MIPIETQKVIDKYPKTAKNTFINLRDLILTSANQLNIQNLEETLKWGEPSFLCKTGSTIRIDWKAKLPNQITIFFNCKTKLIETIQEIYPNEFAYDGNRAMSLDLNQPINDKILIHCFSLALNYHKIKHLHLLGN